MIVTIVTLLYTVGFYFVSLRIRRRSLLFALGRAMDHWHCLYYFFTFFLIHLRMCYYRIYCIIVTRVFTYTVLDLVVATLMYYK
jgi:hypothetical protein